MSYLFGNILMVPQKDIWLMAFMDLVVLTIVWLFYRQFLAVSFDEEFARLRGIPVAAFYLLLLCMVAVTVVLLIQVVGLILVIALLTLPAAIAAQYFKSLGQMMLAASILGMVFTTVGLMISYSADLPSGASIILVAGLVYLVSTIFNQILQRQRQINRA
jgi:zinc transport system permease protein